MNTHPTYPSPRQTVCLARRLCIDLISTSYRAAIGQPAVNAVGRKLRHVGVLFIAASGFALATATLPLTAQAQPTGKAARLCFMTFDQGTPQASRFNPFFQGLRDLK